MMNSRDPGAGEPDVVRRLAAEFQGTADDAGGAARVLRSLKDQTTDAVWSGTSADEFRSRIGDVPGHLDRLQASYGEAAGALTTYAASVQQIKDDANTQKKLIAVASDDHRQAADAQAVWMPPVDPTTGTPDTAAKNPHDEAVAAAAARMGTATGRLHALADDRKVADSKVVAALGHAHDLGMKNKSWFQKFLSVASDVLAKITIVLMVIAIVAIVVLAIVAPALIPALLLLGGQILTGLAAAQLAVDGTRKATGEDVSWGTLGLEALGCLPIVGQLAKGTRLAAKTAEVTASAVARGRTVLNGAADALRASRLRVAGDAGELNLGAFFHGAEDGMEGMPKLGSLSDVEARQWYHAQMDEIMRLIDPSLPLRDQALQAFKMRNEIKLVTRDLMSNRELATALPPPRSLQDVVARAYQSGATGDDVWRYILRGSGKSNIDVDRALGLSGE